MFVLRMIVRCLPCGYMARFRGTLNKPGNFRTQPRWTEAQGGKRAAECVNGLVCGEYKVCSLLCVHVGLAYVCAVPAMWLYGQISRYPEQTWEFPHSAALD